MGWGTKIAILYLGFIGLIVTMVSLSMREKIELETPDYYAQELKFQDKIDKMNRTQELKGTVQWRVNGKELVLNFPEELKGKQVSASIHFICPSDAKSDAHFTMNADTVLQRIISIKDLKTRAYKIQLDWKAGETPYYNEGVITVN